MLGIFMTKGTGLVDCNGLARLIISHNRGHDIMTRHRWFGIVGTLCLLAIPVGAMAASQSHEHGMKELQGDREVTGTVEDIKSDQIQVNIGEVQPRFIPLNEAKEKGLPTIKKGDRLEITVNDQNLIVDYHLIDQSGQPLTEAKHQVVKGQIAQPLVIGHDQAVIRTEDGKELSYVIRSQARSKMASIPVGTDAVFLVDETNKIVDVNFADQDAVNRAGESPDKKSPLKEAQRRVMGTIAEPLAENRITLRTPDGKEQLYEVRSLMREKVGKLSKGEAVVLLIDGENRVVDLAIPPQK
jgi:translation initiation factor IF-1